MGLTPAWAAGIGRLVWLEDAPRVPQAGAYGDSQTRALSPNRLLPSAPWTNWGN